MTKILFVCHGNICRSPTAEYMLKDMVKKAGLEKEFEIASAATDPDELGNPVYPPSRRLLERHGIDCSGKRARLLTKADFAYYDLIIGMDEENLYKLRRRCAPGQAEKLRCMMDYAGKPGQPVADPWYTRDFDRTWQDLTEACTGLLAQLTKK